MGFECNLIITIKFCNNNYSTRLSHDKYYLALEIVRKTKRIRAFYKEFVDTQNMLSYNTMLSYYSNILSTSDTL